MPYGLIVNGSLVSLLDDVKYLLSPQVMPSTCCLRPPCVVVCPVLILLVY